MRGATKRRMWGWALGATMQAACAGGDKGTGPGNPPPPPPPPPPPSGTAVPALEDAAARLLAGLPASCVSGVSASLTQLRAKMSPQRTAAASDVNAVRAALGGCSDDASLPDRDAIRLALDVADDVIAGR